MVNGSFEHERVVDGDSADMRVLVPARLSTTRNRGIHHVVCYEEVGLQEFDSPPKDCRLVVLVIVQWTAPEDLERVDYRDTSVELATWGVVLQVLRECQANVTGAVNPMLKLRRT